MSLGRCECCWPIWVSILTILTIHTPREAEAVGVSTRSTVTVFGSKEPRYLGPFRLQTMAKSGGFHSQQTGQNMSTMTTINRFAKVLVVIQTDSLTMTTMTGFDSHVMSCHVMSCHVMSTTTDIDSCWIVCKHTQLMPLTLTLDSCPIDTKPLVTSRLHRMLHTFLGGLLEHESAFDCHTLHSLEQYPLSNETWGGYSWLNEGLGLDPRQTLCVGGGSLDVVYFYGSPVVPSQFPYRLSLFLWIPALNPCICLHETTRC